MTNYFSYDNHAGGAIGVILGVLFLTFGITLIKVHDKQSRIPIWQKSFGVFITVSGVISLISGIVFMLFPSPRYEAKKQSEDVVLLLKQDIVSRFIDDDKNISHWIDMSLSTEIYPPGAVRIDNKHILHVDSEYKINACTAMYIDSIVLVICAVTNKTSEQTSLLRYVIKQENSILMEKIPIGAIKTLNLFQDNSDIHLKIDDVSRYHWKQNYK
jgi:hypothetical protein